MEDKVEKANIQKIFHSMDYGENLENIDKAIKWIKHTENSFFAYVENKQEPVNGEPTQIKNCVSDNVLCTEYVPDVETIKNILSKVKNQVKWIETNAFQRAKLMNRLADEIEKNADVISQIEIVCRGLTSKDTKSKAVPLLVQYFRFYSSFAVKYGREKPDWKPEGVAVGVISKDNILSNLGLVLAPALAAGYNVILQIGTTLFPSVAFIVELAHKVGIPEQVIRLIPSDDGDIHTYLCSEHVAIVSLLVDLNDEKYKGVNCLNKRILNLSSNKTPVIIFDNADIDSASTSIIDSAWGYQGLLPWSVNLILVQENILNSFVKKLKAKLKTVRVGLGNNKSCDLSFANGDSSDKLKELIRSAKSQGIEVFQAEEDANFFTPTLFVGGKVTTNNVVSADEYKDVNAVTVLAFRSIDEAVNLANNSRQGLAASVWTENIGTANEVTHKLRVSNVWINSHGLTSPEITLCPIKDSGVGYFGGREGFYEYVQVKKIPTVPELKTEVAISNGGFINSVKKSQEGWKRLSKLGKIKLFKKIADYLEDNKEKLRSPYMTEQILDEWIGGLYHCSTQLNNSYSSMILDFNVTTIREPLGVVAIEIGEILQLESIKLVLAALFEGNSVILLVNSTNALSFYNTLSNNFPSAVLSVLNYNVNLNKTLAAYKELGGYFGEEANPVYSYLPIKDSKMYKIVSDNWDDIYRKVTFSKNVWSNIGKSSTCNLSAR